MTPSARCSHFEKFVTINTYQSEYNFVAMNKIKR